MAILIKELKDGDRVSGQFLVGTVSKGVNTMGSQYMNVELKDCSGSISGKKWEIAPNDETILVTGNIIHVEGDALKYKENLQLKIREIKLVDNEDIDISKFVKSSPVPKDVLIERFNSLVNSIENKDCKALLDYFINKYKEKLFDYPAGVSVHHDYTSGLLTHITSMGKVADFLAKQYDADRDLLITGCLLHDIGKLIELEGYVFFKYSTEGKLLGHISIMVSEIKQAAKELNIESEIPLLLEHMVLSHHDKPEYGSPIPPCTKEAMLLSMIDNMDSKMVIIDKALEEVAHGEFSNKVYPIEGRCFYKKK